MDTRDRGLIFGSWNVKGIRDPVKRTKILKHLKSLQMDIIFLQETHLTKDNECKLKARWMGETFHSTFSSRMRGVSIIFKKGLSFQHKRTITDKEGRYIIVIGELYGTHITLLNVYAPNTDNPAFYHKMFNLIPDISQTHLIIGGDFNTTLDPYLDRYSTGNIVRNASSETLNAFIENTNIVDLWRIKNPTSRGYSFYSPVHRSYSRIDFFPGGF